MNWNCECGHQNKEEARFCDQCGAPRPQVEDAALSAGGAAPTEPRQSQAPPPQGEPLPTGSSPAASKKSRRGCWIAAIAGIAVLILLLAALAAAVYFLVLPKLRHGAHTAETGMTALSESTVSEEAKQAKAMADLRLIAVALQSYQSNEGRLPSPGHTPDSYYSIVDMSSLSGSLCPRYCPSIPKDPWGNSYLYGISYDDKSYVLICTGSDGVNGLEKIPDSPLETSCFEDEMVIEDGAVLQRPGGRQRHCGDSIPNP